MNPVDPAREKVERADAVVREFEEPVIDDPTVFVKGAALGALTLIALAKLAQARTQDAKVRALADGVRRNQEAMRKELASIAGRKRLDVPGSLVFNDEQMLQSAPQGRGAEFDSWFVLQAHAEHLKAIALFESAANMKDRDLAAFAKRSVGALEADRKALSAR
jgi:putative membrane protein